MQLVKPDEARPLCQATVDLISRVYRPWLFRVTVCGLPPHAFTKVYEIQGASESDAAFAGIDRFVKEATRPRIADHLAPVIWQ